jgi:hypothetical protein
MFVQFVRMAYHWRTSTFRACKQTSIQIRQHKNTNAKIERTLNLQESFFDLVELRHSDLRIDIYIECTNNKTESAPHLLVATVYVDALAGDPRARIRDAAARRIVALARRRRRVVVALAVVGAVAVFVVVVAHVQTLVDRLQAQQSQHAKDSVSALLLLLVFFFTIISSSSSDKPYGSLYECEQYTTSNHTNNKQHSATQNTKHRTQRDSCKLGNITDSLACTPFRPPAHTQRQTTTNNDNNEFTIDLCLPRCKRKKRTSKASSSSSSNSSPSSADLRLQPRARARNRTNVNRIENEMTASRTKTNERTKRKRKRTYEVNDAERRERRSERVPPPTWCVCVSRVRVHVGCASVHVDNHACVCMCRNSRE